MLALCVGRLHGGTLGKCIIYMGEADLARYVCPSWELFLFHSGRAEHTQNTCFGASRGSKAREIKPRNPRKIGGFGWETSVFARFGYVFGAKNVAKPSENVVFPAGTS